jgi:hypothetical protein
MVPSVGHGHYRAALTRYMSRYLYGALATIVFEYLSLLRPNSYTTVEAATTIASANASIAIPPGGVRPIEPVSAIAVPNDDDSYDYLLPTITTAPRTDPKSLGRRAHNDDCECHQCGDDFYVPEWWGDLFG